MSNGSKVRSVMAKVALRKESVDRNTQRRDFKALGLPVALRKESVDRNICASPLMWPWSRSLSARRAWIEILDEDDPDNLWSEVALRKESVDRNSTYVTRLPRAQGRSPQGERG